MKSPRILYLVDKVDYVETNCFQCQLLSAMKYCAEVEFFPVYPKLFFFARRRIVDPKKYDAVVSVLRLRTLHQLWPELQAWLNGCPLTIYDQDPWESYIDGAPTKGVYHVLRDKLNLRAVFVTSKWWSERLASDGLPASFVRMGMEPRLCDVGPDYKDRPILLGFKGSVHAHRREIFDRMQKVGVQVEVSAAHLDYPRYLDYLQTLKIFTHDESAPWICDGTPINRSSGMWVKSVETAARGAFVMRNYLEEGETYEVSDIPLIQFYKCPEEAADIILRLEKMDPNERRSIQKKSVAAIRERNDWTKTASKIIGTATGC